MSSETAILAEPGPEPDDSGAYGTDPDQVADVWHGADRDRPLLVMLHGGFWRPRTDRAHTRRMGAALRDAGWSVVVPEYRRLPGRPDATTDDVRAALGSLPELIGRTPRGVVVVGHSAGGHLALWSAAAAPAADLRLTVALAPVADLVLSYREHLGGGAVEAFLGESPETHAGLDPVRLPAPATPVAILHGSEDDTVPVEVSHSLVRSHPTVGLEVIEGADHFDLIDPGSEAFARVLATLERSLTPA